MPSSRLFIFIFIFIVHSFAAPSPAETLDELDAVLTRAGSLDAFLGERQWIDEYYAVAQRYYGAERFPRAAYDQILAQLRQLAHSLPEIKGRLWETGNQGPEFSIAGSIKSHGRKLDRARWTTFYERTTAEILQSGNRDAKRTADVVTKLKEKFAEAEARFSRMIRSDAARARAESYKSLQADPEARAAAADLAGELLLAEGTKDKLESGVPDLVLETVKDLHSKTRELLGRDPGPLMSMVLDRIPRVDALLADTALFPVETRKTRSGAEVPVGTLSANVVFKFKPLPRRFHGIFKGIPLKECVGGGRWEGTTPQRWATAALTGSRQYVVERHGAGEVAYDGFIQHVPLKGPDGRIYASTDFGAPSLRQSLTVNSTGKTRPLYELALVELHQRMAPEWAGLVVGESHAINNSGVLDVLHRSPTYLASPRVGEAASFRPIDDFDAKIARRSPQVPYDYGRGMIFDGTVPEAGWLVRLDPNGEAVARDPALIRHVLGGNDMERKARLLRYLRAAELSADMKAVLDAHPGLAEIAWWDSSRLVYSANVNEYRRTSGMRGRLNLLIFGTFATPLTFFIPGLPTVIPSLVSALGGVIGAATALEFLGQTYPLQSAKFAILQRPLLKAEARERAARGVSSSTAIGRGCRAVWRGFFMSRSL